MKYNIISSFCAGNYYPQKHGIAFIGFYQENH